MRDHYLSRNCNNLLFDCQPFKNGHLAMKNGYSRVADKYKGQSMFRVRILKIKIQ